MKLSDFDFELPEELIAHEPTKERDESKILICNSDLKNKITKFHNIINEIRSDDVIIFNDSKVINAQLKLLKAGKKIHANLNREISDNLWNGYAKPAKKLKIGDEFVFGDSKIIIEQKEDNGLIHFRFILKDCNIFEFLDRHGEVPLPQYIKRDEQKEADKERYQSVFARHPGSVAAPTASLHFTSDLLDKIKSKGVAIEYVTLHVGAGTFLPVKTENIAEHKMHSEYVTISEETAERINKAKADGRRVIVIGTTAMRAVESFIEGDKLGYGTKDTSIFIRPGYKFKIADAMITNFHFPKSTLFMLICAFSGYEEMREAYEFAIENKMRFFSYGDAMFIQLKK